MLEHQRFFNENGVTMKTSFISLFGLLIFYFYGPVLWAQEIPTRPSDVKLLQNLVNNPQALKSQVTIVTQGGKEYCSVLGDYHGVFPVSVEKLSGVVGNLEAYPQIFSKVKQVLVTRSPEGVFQEQTVVLSLLGLENKSWLKNQIFTPDTRNAKSRWFQWKQVEGNGTIQESLGYWYLEEFPLDGKVMTYLRYHTTSEIPKTVFGQEGIMGMFLEGEIKDVIFSALRAALK